MRRRLIVGVSTVTSLFLGPALPAYAAPTTGTALLSRLTVTAETDWDSYERTEFGSRWLDADRDGCNTRQEVLIKESLVPVTPRRYCSVPAGRWVSWYDQATWTAPADVDIDHVVALKEAWDSGASTWTKEDRLRYANDLGYPWTLDAITDDVNAAKSHMDAAGWLPEHHVCKYARHIVGIKYRWRLSIDDAEKNALAGILTGECGQLAITVPKRAI